MKRTAMFITAALALSACQKKPPIEDMVNDAAGDAAADAIVDSPRISQMESDIEQLRNDVADLQDQVRRNERDIEEHKLLGH